MAFNKKHPRRCQLFAHPALKQRCRRMEHKYFLETATFDVYCTHANKPQELTLHSSILTDDFEEYRAVSTASSFLFGGPLLGITQAATSSSNEHLFRRFPPIAHVVFAQSPATTHSLIDRPI